MARRRVGGLCGWLLVVCAPSLSAAFRGPAAVPRREATARRAVAGGLRDGGPDDAAAPLVVASLLGQTLFTDQLLGVENLCWTPAQFFNS